VALHRHLAQRIAKYDYDVHFGGVYYLFVRGMHPSTGAGPGVFFHRPSRRLIERLSALLDDPLAESGEAAKPTEVATR
jgi:exodeoxyribonuclease V beta subunit